MSDGKNPEIVCFHYMLFSEIAAEMKELEQRRRSIAAVRPHVQDSVYHVAVI